MSLITWRAQRRLAVFTIVFGTVGIVVTIFVFLNLSEPTCFDGKLNQEEEGIDCGGPCGQCITNPKEIIVLWSRVFEVGEGLYEPAALLENPNLFYGMPFLNYTFKLFDANNVLVSVKQDKTFLNPQDRFVVLVPPIDTGSRKPVRASIEIKSVSDWQYIEESKISLVVSEKRFFNDPFPTLQAYLYNESLFSVEQIYTAAVLYDENGNATAASSGLIDYIGAESGKRITFTWPVSFEKLPATSEIFTRIDLTNSEFFDH